MYKDKKIIFKQEDEQNIGIYLSYEDLKPNGEAGLERKEKLIGHIQTPSGTGGQYVNAIQVCGISEAFDYQDCGLFAKPMLKPKMPDNYCRGYYYDSKGNKVMEQVREIQLYFDEDTQNYSLDSIDVCSIKEDIDVISEAFSVTKTFYIKKAFEISELEELKKK